MKADLLKPVYEYFEACRKEECDRAREAFYDGLDVGSLTVTPDEAENLFGAWLLLDYRTTWEKKSLLDIYLTNDPDVMSDEDRLLLTQMLETQFFDVFEVTAVVPEESLTLRQMRTGKLYTVREKLGTRGMAPGTLLFCRPFRHDDHWEMAGGLLAFSSISTMQALRIYLDGLPKKAVPSVPSFLRLFASKKQSPVDEKQSAIVEMNAYLLMQRVGDAIDAETILGWLRETRNVEEVLRRCLLAFRPRSEKAHGELLDRVTDLYQTLEPSQDDPCDPDLEGWKPGPVEMSLLERLRRHVSDTVDMDSYDNLGELNERVRQVQEEWIDSPLATLNGRTPRQAVAQERREGKHPIEDWTVEMSISRLPDSSRGRATVLFDEANACMGRGEDARAEELYRRLVKEHPQDYKAWGNLGIALAKQQRKEEAEEALETALGIAPDYKLASRNLEILRTTDPETFRELKNVSAGVLTIGLEESAFSEWMPLIRSAEAAAVPAVRDATAILAWVRGNACPITPKKKELTKRMIAQWNGLLIAADPSEMTLHGPGRKTLTTSMTDECQYPTVHRLHQMLLTLNVLKEYGGKLVEGDRASWFDDGNDCKRFCTLLWCYCSDLDWSVLSRRHASLPDFHPQADVQDQLENLIGEMLACDEDSDGWIEADAVFRSFETSPGTSMLLDGLSIRFVFEPLAWFGLLECRYETDAMGFRHVDEIRLTDLGKHILPTMTYSEPKTSAAIPPEASCSTPAGIRRLSEERTPKVGRNDPCPCGSGKKYKKCCL